MEKLLPTSFSVPAVLASACTAKDMGQGPRGQNKYAQLNVLHIKATAASKPRNMLKTRQEAKPRIAIMIKIGAWYVKDTISLEVPVAYNKLIL